MAAENEHTADYDALVPYPERTCPSCGHRWADSMIDCPMCGVDGCVIPPAETCACPPEWIAAGGGCQCPIPPAVTAGEVDA